MKKRLVLLGVFFIISACSEKKVSVQKKTIKKKTAAGCRLSCRFEYQKVCLDGEWFIKPSFLKERITFCFKKKGRLIFLIPQLKAGEKSRLRSRIAAGALEQGDVRSLLSYRGSVQQGRLEISQHNPLVSYHETYRYTLRYIGPGKFSGYLKIIGRHRQSSDTWTATLLRRDKAGLSSVIKKDRMTDF